MSIEVRKSNQIVYEFKHGNQVQERYMDCSLGKTSRMQQMYETVCKFKRSNTTQENPLIDL